jgi:hypothetical protein
LITKRKETCDGLGGSILVKFVGPLNFSLSNKKKPKYENFILTDKKLMNKNKIKDNRTAKSNVTMLLNFFFVIVLSFQNKMSYVRL